MSKLTFELTRVDVKKKGNYFVLIQLDETEFPSKLMRTIKYRTEIDYSTEFPNFLKNYFTFSQVQLGNKLIFRVGLFMFNNVSAITSEQKRANLIPEKVLFDNSIMLGSAEIVMDSNWIESLRNSEYVDSNKRLISTEIRNNEVGSIYFRIKCKSETLDTKIYEDNKEIEKEYYNPFEKDNKTISEKLKAVIILNEEKQIDLEKTEKKYDETNRKLKYAIMEKSRAQKELEDIVNENNNLIKNLNKIQNYDEIHIEIDLLSQSPQGIIMMEKKYAVLLGQYQLQKNIRLEMEQQYNQIEPILSKINIIKTRLETVKSANTELKFNHKRHEDMLPLVTTYQNKIKTNDSIIQNLQNNINDINQIKNNNSNLTNNELLNKIDIYEKERKKLEEKKIQMNLFIDVYFKENGKSKRTKTYDELSDPFYRIIGSDPTMNQILNDTQNTLLESNKIKINELNAQVKELSDSISKFEHNEKIKKEQGIIISPQLILKRNNIKEKIEIENKRVNFLINEIEKNKQEFISAKQMLKDKINYYDELIEQELKFARMKKYEDDSNKEYYKQIHENEYND